MRHRWLYRSMILSDVGGYGPAPPTIARKVSTTTLGRVSLPGADGVWKPIPLGGPSHQCVVHDEDDDRPDDGDEYAPQINTGDTCRA